MAQVHSRPGFQPRVTHEGRKTPPPAKVTSDMRPALANRSTPTLAPSNSPLTQQPAAAGPSPDMMQARAEAALARMQDMTRAEAALARVQEEKRKAGPEVLVNPNPSATPILTTPHKD